MDNENRRELNYIKNRFNLFDKGIETIRKEIYPKDLSIQKSILAITKNMGYIYYKSR